MLCAGPRRRSHDARSLAAAGPAVSGVTSAPVHQLKYGATRGFADCHQVIKVEIVRGVAGHLVTWVGVGLIAQPALGDADSAIEESWSEALDGLPEYPHYTRPAEYRGWGIPEVLISGNHERVREWRLEQSRRRGAH